ncbi:TetR/AcrR family transcriptional regulator [Streptomyces sp. NBC_01363]|uniref:TetR/AcrR family transcriptional regulator n=1 Tax=Streptomyces sp. NBC_01363 TaxID=2903840 RepID=UPI00224F3CD7|nr:TetR/AcrR family transcriptional regulator [Streptomyces sp. NBC_01363]MCX4736959.1 TetR family transcriptional regulator [Streptomyces sp. NBC_01363]
MGYLTAAERHSRIVEAATRVIARDGLAAATTRRIANEAGVNLAALHYSFKGKDEIYAAVDDTLRASIIGSNPEPAEAHTCQEITRSLISRFQYLLRTDRQAAIAQYELLLWALRTPHKVQLAARSYQSFIGAFADRLERAVDAGDRDVTLLARYTVGAIDGIYVQNLAAGTDGVSESELDAISRAIVDIADAVKQ